jgi:AraC-like DNA-binding protein
MSPRALGRGLQQENTSFTNLQESVHKERALHYVEETNMAPQHIARLLGFATTATFCRAFLRWTGTSPLHHRRARRAARN